MKWMTKCAAVAAIASCVTVFAQDRNKDSELDAKTLEGRRQEILDMTEKTVDNLRDTDKGAADLLRESYGYAVFDTTKGGFLVTGAGGTGAAMRKGARGKPIFMHMGAAGVGLGAGLENYKLILIFQNEDTYNRFVDGSWSAGASAQAAAGREGKAAVGRFVNGVAVYHITDKGVIAQADITGVKFWPSDRLNPGVA